MFQTNRPKVGCRTSQEKPCPRGAFLGLFSKDPNITKNKNAVYAQKAVSILKRNPNIKYSTKSLWIEVLKGLNENLDKASNSQMDVVLALWNNKLI